MVTRWPCGKPRESIGYLHRDGEKPAVDSRAVDLVLMIMILEQTVLNARNCNYSILVADLVFDQHRIVNTWLYQTFIIKHI